MAIISGVPTRNWDKNPLPPDQMVATRKYVNDLAGSQRVLSHGLLRPNLGKKELDEMERQVSGRGHVGDRRDPADPGHQGEDDDHAKPEGGHRQTGQREDPQRVVKSAVLPHRADHPGRNAEKRRDRRRDQGQFHGDGDERLDELPGGQVITVGLAKISADDIRDPPQVLRPDRAIEAELRHDQSFLCLIHVAPGREEDINDVAGGESEQDKDDDRHAEQRQHGDAEAAGDIPAHGSLRPGRPGAGRAYRSNQTSCMRLQL